MDTHSSVWFYLTLAALLGLVLASAAAIHLDRTSKQLRNMLRLMRRADIWQRGHNNVLAQIVADDSLNDILLGIVVGVEHLRPEMTCSIVLVDRTSNSFTVAAAPHLPDFYHHIVSKLPVDPPGGAWGEVVTSGRRVIEGNIQQDAIWAPVRE